VNIIIELLILQCNNRFKYYYLASDGITARRECSYLAVIKTTCVLCILYFYYGIPGTPYYNILGQASHLGTSILTERHEIIIHNVLFLSWLSIFLRPGSYGLLLQQHTAECVRNYIIITMTFGRWEIGR